MSPEAKNALDRARRMVTSYGVRYYALPGPTARTLVVLGEAHVKLGAAAALGREIVGQFALRGVETFQTKRVFAGQLLAPLINLPRLALRALTFGLVKGSTIVEAKRVAYGHSVEIERSKDVPLGLHVGSAYLTVFFGLVWLQAIVTLVWRPIPELTYAILLLELHFVLMIVAIIVRRHPWSWLVHPAIAILTIRDTLMAEGTVQMLADHPNESEAIVIMGRAHLPGFERELVEKHGFRRLDL